MLKRFEFDPKHRPALRYKLSQHPRTPNEIPAQELPWRTSERKDLEEVLKAQFVLQYSETQRPIIEVLIRYYCTVEQPNFLITGPLQEPTIVYPVEWIRTEPLPDYPYYTGPLLQIYNRANASRGFLKRALELGHPPFLTYNVFEHPYTRRLLENEDSRNDGHGPAHRRND